MLILVFGAVISLVAQQWLDAVIILLIVLGSTVLGFVQEYRASDAIRRLRETLALKVMALRDGRPTSIDFKSVVPGDVILLSAGNLVPADGIVLEARDFLVSQSALTGESFPVEKTPGPTPPRRVAAAARQRRVSRHFGPQRLRQGPGRAHRKDDRGRTHRRRARPIRPVKPISNAAFAGSATC